MPQLTNSAVSATTSSYTSQCVHDFVPSDADLVLVEFSVNDWEVADAAAAWMNNSQRRAPCFSLAARRVRTEKTDLSVLAPSCERRRVLERSPLSLRNLGQ